MTGPLADALNWTTMSTEDWNTALSGNSKAQKAFSKAIKKGASAEDAFNEALAKCSTEQERQSLITSALNGLYGEAAAAYEDTNGSIMDANRAQANYNNSLAGLGEIIEPIKTTFMNGMAGMLESVTEFISGLDMEAVKSAIQGAFDYLDTTVFPAIKEGIQWFIDNKDLVIAGVAGIVAGIAAFKIVSVVQTAIGIFKSFQAATTGLTLAQKALNLVMQMNPIGLVIAAVTALVAAFIYLWNNCEGFRNFWIGLWENIKTATGVVVDALINFFTVTIPEAWSAFVPWVTELWNTIWTTISGFAANIWNSVVTWFTNTKNDAANAISGLWTSVTTWFSNIWTSVTTFAMNIWTSVTTWFTNIWNSITTIVSNIWTSVTTWFTNIWTSITGIATNIWASITSIFNSIKTSVTSIWNAVKTAIVNAWNGIKTAVSTAINAVRNTVNTVFNAVKSFVTTVWNGIKTTITTVWNNIKTGVSTAINNVKSTVSTVFNTVKSNVSSVWNGIKSTITSVWNGIKSGVSSAINSVKSTVSSVFNSVKSTVSSVWDGIKSTITGKIEGAKDKVKSVIDAIKGFFDFKFKWPSIPMPHFSISPSGWKIGDLLKGSIPSLGISWYAKGGILEGPTLFGMGANGNLLGGGEAGPEAVAPIDVLLGYVREAVEDVMSAMTFSVDNGSHMDKLETSINASNNSMERLIDAIEDLASRAINIDIDSMRVAEATAGASDSVSGNRLNLRERGLAF